MVREFDERLGADVVRINLAWSVAEPRRGVYNADYLARAAAAVGAIRARGMQAIVLVYHTPRWASDRSLWARPVTGDRAGVYHSYYPPAVDALDEFGAFAQHLSTDARGPGARLLLLGGAEPVDVPVPAADLVGLRLRGASLHDGCSRPSHRACVPATRRPR